jgi:hypothetical protein
MRTRSIAAPGVLARQPSPSRLSRYSYAHHAPFAVHTIHAAQAKHSQRPTTMLPIAAIATERSRGSQCLRSLALSQVRECDYNKTLPYPSQRTHFINASHVTHSSTVQLGSKSTLIPSTLTHVHCFCKNACLPTRN